MKRFSTLMLGAVLIAQAAVAQTKQDVIASIEKVNDYWQSHNSARCRGFWDNAAYFTGNIEAYNLTKKKEYLDYANKWAEHNHWTGATEPYPEKWEYKTYGEDMRHMLSGFSIIIILAADII